MKNLRQLAGEKTFRAGPPPSARISVIRTAAQPIRDLAEELEFETDNLQLRIEFRGRVLYAHDFVHGTETGMDALRSFDKSEVIDGTNPAQPELVDINDPDLDILKERVQRWKETWTPHEILKAGCIRNMTDLLNDSSTHGAVLNSAIPG